MADRNLYLELTEAEYVAIEAAGMQTGKTILGFIHDAAMAAARKAITPTSVEPTEAKKAVRDAPDLAGKTGQRAG